jgi:hypothetical protein
LKKDSSFIKLFSSRFAAPVCILLALLCRFFYQYYTFDVTGDKSFQLVAAKNLLEGNGFSFRDLINANIDQPVYRPVTGWPPGYPLLLAAAGAVFNKDFITAALVVDLLSVIPLLLYCRKMLFYISTPLYLVNLFTLFSGFFYYRFNGAGATDTLAVTLLVMAFYYWLRLLSPDNSTATKGIWLTALCLTGAYLFRFMYLPVICLFPLLLLGAGFLQQQKKWMRSAVKTGLLLAAGIAGVWLLQRSYGGNADYLLKSKMGFFPDNLQLTYPFIPASIFNPELASSLLEKSVKIPFLTGMHFFQLINAALLVLLLAVFILYVKKNNAIIRHPLPAFILMGGILAIAVAFLSIFLSAFFEPLIMENGERWTYAKEPRYYAFTTVFLQLLVFGYLFTASGQYPLSLLKKGILLLLAGASLHSFIFICKTVAAGTQSWHSPASDYYLRKELDQEIDTIKKRYNEKQFLFTSTNQSLISIGELKGYAVFYNPGLLNNIAALSSAKEKRILFVMDRQKANTYAGLLKQSFVTLWSRKGQLDYYIIDVPASPR